MRYWLTIALRSVPFALGVVDFGTKALWVQSSLAEMQFEQGDALSQPICKESCIRQFHPLFTPQRLMRKS